MKEGISECLQNLHLIYNDFIQKKTINYKNANRIIFMMDEEQGRYGFLHSVRNPEEE